jgi:hypothetical protein
VRAWLPWVLLLAVFLLAGCGDARAIEDRALVIAVGVAPGRSPAQKSWVFVIPNVAVTASNIASNVAPGQQVFAVTVEAPDWTSALGEISQRLSRDIFLGQLEILAVDRRLDWSAVTSVVDALNEDGVIPKNYYVVVSAGPVLQLLTQITPQEVIPRYFLATYFDVCRTCHSAQWSVMGWEWWQKSVTPGVNPYAPVATVTPVGARIATLAVYREGGPPLVMPPKVALGFSYLTGRALKETWVGRAEGQLLSAARLHGEARTDARLARGRIRVQGTLRVSGFLNASPIGRSPAHWIALAQAEAARDIASACSEAVTWANRTHTDPFGFTRDAIAKFPASSSRLPTRAQVILPIEARVSVVVRLLMSGTKA